MAEAFIKLCWTGDLNNIKSALAKNAALINCAREKDHVRPLHVAVIRKNVELLALLLDCGADVDAKHVSGATGLILAAQEGSLECAVRLMDAGAALDARSSVGATPCFIAAQMGHHKLLGVLIERGCNVEVATTEGATPLIVAAQKGHAECVRVLVGEGKANVRATMGGITVLEHALNYGREECAVLLVKYGAPLQVAVEPKGEDGLASDLSRVVKIMSAAAVAAQEADSAYGAAADPAKLRKNKSSRDSKSPETGAKGGASAKPDAVAVADAWARALEQNERQHALKVAQLQQTVANLESVVRAWRSAYAALAARCNE